MQTSLISILEESERVLQNEAMVNKTSVLQDKFCKLGFSFFIFARYVRTSCKFQVSFFFGFLGLISFAALESLLIIDVSDKRSIAGCI